MFLVGVSQVEEENERIRNESLEYEDILEGDYKENNFHLTVKVIGSFKWVTQRSQCQICDENKQ